MIIRDRILGDINNGVQDMVVDAVVDKQSDLPAQNAVADFNIVTPSTCHCVQESTDWQMDSTGAWYKQKSTQDVNATVQLDLTNYYTKAETDQAIEDAVEDIDLTNYYTKTETDQAISTAISGIDLTNYYTKTETDQYFYEKITIDNMFTYYYDKTSINSMLSNYVTTTNLTANYYTKSQVNNKFVDSTAYGELNTIVRYFCPSMTSGIAIPSNFDLDNINSFLDLKQQYGVFSPAFGKFFCSAVNAQTSLHKPVTQPGGYGVWMEAFGTADNNRFVQTLVYNVTGSASNRNKIYKRFYSSGGWSNWFVMDMTEIIP